MIVRLLISYLLLIWRSLSDSPKSSATSAEDAPESEPRGDLADMATISSDQEETLHDADRCYLDCSGRAAVTQ